MRITHKILLSSITLLVLILISAGSSIVSQGRVQSGVHALLELFHEQEESIKITSIVSNIQNNIDQYIKNSDKELVPLIKKDFKKVHKELDTSMKFIANERHLEEVKAVSEVVKNYETTFSKIEKAIGKRQVILNEEMPKTFKEISSALAEISEVMSLGADVDTALVASGTRAHFLNALININIFLRTHDGDSKIRYTNAMASFLEEADILSAYLSDDKLIAKLEKAIKLTADYKIKFKEGESLYKEVTVLNTKVLTRLSKNMNEAVEVFNNDILPAKNEGIASMENDFTFFTALGWGIMVIGLAVAGGVSFYILKSTNQTINQLVSIFKGTYEGIQSVGSDANLVSDNANNMSASANEAEEISSTVAGRVNELAVNVNEVGVSIEEMDGSISEIANRINQSVSLIEAMSGHAEQTNQVVERLQVSSSQINDVVELINGLAEQTNLLALNASIEAARAGDAGRGFAVVAEEVKKLAISTTEATSKINGEVQEMQAVSDEASTSISSIVGSVQTIKENTFVINQSIEEQKSASSAISSNMYSASESSGQVNDDISHIADASSKNKNSSEALLEAADGMKNESNKMLKDAKTFLDKLENM